MEEFETRHGSPCCTIMLGGQRVSLEDAPEGTRVDEVEPQEETEQQAKQAEEAEQPRLRRSSRTRTQVSSRPQTQRRGSHPPPRPQGPPLVVHLDLRAATARQVQQLHFMEFEEWFSPRQDGRASEQFYTVLQEDFYNAYLNSGVAFRS